MPQIAPETIEEIRQRIDIVDVISEYVVLKKRGKNLVGLCPFHQEKTGSFTVSPSKQMYHCFGCGAGGNGIKFLMELKKQSFSEVVFDLAQRYQIPLKTLSHEKRQELVRELSLKEQLYEILAVAGSFYQHSLRQPPGKEALEYLQQVRKLKDETIEQFQLGYASAGWETLYRYLVEQKRYPIALVAQAGLIKPRQSGDGYYDQFRARLMIPIHDLRGRIIGFGSRTLAGEQPKYLNSPETSLFDKGKTLFALDKAYQNIIQQDQVLVVEGYFDAITLHEAGINNVVASLGTAFSQTQLRQILRYTESKRVIFNFDADNAGVKATQRAISEIRDLIYAGQVQLRILNIPNGKDADEFLKTSADGGEKFRQMIANAPHWFDWQLQQLLKEHDLKQPEHYQQVAQNMVKLLNDLENIHQRTYYLRRCADILSQGDKNRIRLLEDKLERQLRRPQLNLGNKKGASSQFTLEEDKNSLEQAEEELLIIYLHCPEKRAKIHRIIEKKDFVFSTQKYRKLWAKIIKINEREVMAMSLVGAHKQTNGNTLMAAIQDEIMLLPEVMEQVKHLFSPSEVRGEDLIDPETKIDDIFIRIERIIAEKYKKYCLQQLKKSTSVEEQSKWIQKLTIMSRQVAVMSRES